MTKMTKWIIILLLVFASNNCFFSKTEISKIELERIIHFVQKERYNNIWKNKQIYSDKDVFFIACQNYDFDRKSARIKLEKYYPKIYNKIFN